MKYTALALLVSLASIGWAGVAYAEVGSSAFAATTNGTVGFSTTDTIIPFNTELFDTGGNFDDSTYTYTVPSNGTYIITARMVAFSSSGASQSAWITVRNGATEICRNATNVNQSNHSEGIQLSCIRSLEEGDTITVYADDESTYSYDVPAGQLYAEFSMAEIDAESGGGGDEVAAIEELNENAAGMGFMALMGIGTLLGLKVSRYD